MISRFLVAWALLSIGLARAEPAKVTCLRGNCFLRVRQSAWNLQIAEGAAVSAQLGDTALSIGDGTELKIEFADGTISQLKNTGILKVEKGTQRTLLTQGAESGTGAFKKQGALKKGGNLLYLGNLALNLITPPVETPILVTHFPFQLKAAFRIEGASSSLPSTEFLKNWHFSKKASKERPAEKMVEFIADATAGMYSTILTVSEPGEYLISADAGAVDSGFLVVIKGEDSLDSEVRNLLKNADDQSGAKVELRGD